MLMFQVCILSTLLLNSLANPFDWYPSCSFLFPDFEYSSTIQNFIKLMELLPDSYKNSSYTLGKVTEIMRFGTKRPNQPDFIDDLSRKLVDHYVFRYSKITYPGVNHRVKDFYDKVYNLATDREFLKLKLAERPDYLREFVRKKGNKLKDEDKMRFDDIETAAKNNLIQLGLYHDVQQLKP